MRPAYIKALFAGTIFSSAFLLFLVQPLIAKQILPWFGGSAAVWSVCMVFFQVVLLAGYAYSDWVTRRLSVRVQARLHVALLLASLAFLPIVTSARWKPTGAEDPAWWILGLLLATIGLPYFLLSTTGPLVQSWVARTPWGAQVYRYFSLSNLASLASLLSYPVLIEPRSTVVQQSWGWSWGYSLFVVLCSAATLYVSRRWAGSAVVSVPDVDARRASTAPDAPPRAGDYLLWLVLPALASWLLLAVSNHITQNVAAIPFLWVLPLSVYLLSFVLTFESDRWYRRTVVLPLAAFMLVLCAFGLQDSIGSHVKTALPIYVAGLFVLCMFLHGEMARLRPGARYLTRFYLMLSLGGAVGGVTVGLVAPHVLPAYYELGIGLVLVALAGVALLRTRRILVFSALALAACCAWFLALQVRNDVTDARRMTRNFYGTLSTIDTHRDDPADDVRKLFHGSVKHGEQYLAPARRHEPTAYYGPHSGIGLAISAAPQRPRRVGVIGLGAGTLAVYGRPGDVYRFYEINPQVFELADTEFSFLADSAARIERVLGDARLALERDSAQAFDVLAVDAFSGGAVPIHLITAEAIDVYLRHMQPGGVIAFNVTNRFIALAPVVEKVALARGLHAALVHDEAENSAFRRTDYVLVARDPQALMRHPIRGATSTPEPIASLEPWTDDFNNLFGVLK
jgi:hypothetical protein